MGEQLSITTFIDNELERVSPCEPWYPLAVGALATIRNQWAPNTRMAYRYGLRCWHDWARQYARRETMPPDPRDVVMWLHWQDEIKKYARKTIYLHLSGLAWAAQWSQKEPGKEQYSLQHHPLILAWKRGHTRASVARKRDPTPPTRDELRALIMACDAPHTTRKGPGRTPFLAARDRAYLLLSYYGAMRKGEICALRVGDVVVTGRGLGITFRRSKTDQHGEGEFRAVLPQDEIMMCPVDAWQRWLSFYRPANGDAPAFCTASWKPISYHTLDTLVSNRCRDAGIRHLHPHQLRAAFATHALESNEEGEVACHGRWKSRSTMDRYVKRSKTWKKNPTARLSESVT